jgi:hypothetical protein
MGSILHPIIAQGRPVVPAQKRIGREQIHRFCVHKTWAISPKFHDDLMGIMNYALF